MSLLHSQRVPEQHSTALTKHCCAFAVAAGPCASLCSAQRSECAMLTSAASHAQHEAARSESVVRGAWSPHPRRTGFICGARARRHRRARAGHGRSDPCGPWQLAHVGPLCSRRSGAVSRTATLFRRDSSAGWAAVTAPNALSPLQGLLRLRSAVCHRRSRATSSTRQQRVQRRSGRRTLQCCRGQRSTICWRVGLPRR